MFKKVPKTPLRLSSPILSKPLYNNSPLSFYIEACNGNVNHLLIGRKPFKMNGEIRANSKNIK